MREFRRSLTIAAPPTRVLDAFFEHDALAAWCRVVRSECAPRPLGSYTLEWPATEWRDELLGRLGGALRGTVMEFVAGREFFIAEVYWLPPDGDPIGPMAIEATCKAQDAGTLLRVRQSGWDRNPRWSRYYEVLTASMTPALDDLRAFVETGNVDRAT